MVMRLTASSHPVELGDKTAAHNHQDRLDTGHAFVRWAASAGPAFTDRGRDHRRRPTGL